MIEIGAGASVAAIEFGPPDQALDILFLHANGFNAGTYAPILSPLAPALRVMAVDLRGHGRTTLPVPDMHPGWRIYADDLRALVAVLGAAPRVLAGHSMGGTTALLAAPHLAGVERLVLFDPVIVPAPIYARVPRALDTETPMAQAARRRKAWFASREEAFAAYRGRGGFRSWPDAILHAYLEDGLTPAEEGGFALGCAPAWEAANFAAYGLDDPLAHLPDIAAQISVLRAEHGSTCAWEDERVCTVAGTSHFLPMERPERVRHALAQALSGA